MLYVEQTIHMQIMTGRFEAGERGLWESRYFGVAALGKSCKRIGYLIDNQQFLRSADYSRMPEYEGTDCRKSDQFLCKTARRN